MNSNPTTHDELIAQAVEDASTVPAAIRMQEIARDIARRGFDAEVIYRAMAEMAAAAAIDAIVWAAEEDRRAEEAA